MLQKRIYPTKKIAGRKLAGKKSDHAPEIEIKNSHTKPEYYEKIQQIAYSLYEQRGRTDGNDLDDWFKAEEIVKQEQLSHELAEHLN